jgi:hypothetical protein
VKWLHENIVTVNVPRETVRNAHHFSLAIVDTIDYKDSNQIDPEKIKDDHFVSKIGEEAAKMAISTFGKVTGPDYTIYNSKAKSWDDDLFINNTGIAIKTQRRTNAQKYGLSWTFQSGDAREDSILHKPDAWVIFVEYDDTDPKNNPYCCNVFPPYQIKQLTFKEPKLFRLKSSKKVVYADTLIL